MPGIEGSLPFGENSASAAKSSRQASRLILLTIRKESRTVSVRGKLVFQRYGTSFFLAEVWSQNNATSETLAPSAREKERARKKQPEQILVVRAR